MLNSFFQAVLFCFIAMVYPIFAEADWVFEPSSTSSANATELVFQKRSGTDTISARSLCLSAGCRVIYQFQNYRVIIENPNLRRSAILSPLTDHVLIDGKVLESSGVMADASYGYLLPASLAGSILNGLGLGTLKLRPNKDQKVVRHVSTDGPVLVLDPGHGGNDLGTGHGSLYEKDIALRYVIALREALEKMGAPFRVLLTRSEDRFVSLAERARIANDNNAVLFLSLHVNHAANPNVDGVETFILNPEATDDDARKLALLENASWMKSSNLKDSVSGAAGLSKDKTVEKILIDVEQTKYIQESARFAALVHREIRPLESTFGLRSRGVKQGMFYVLSQVAMPSTLIEVGFLSSAGDRGRLLNPKFKNQFVERLADALARFQK